MSLPVTSSLPIQRPQTLKPADVAPKNTDQAAKKDDSFSFRDFIDIINPLQHIPVVSTIYREITGDEIKNTSRIIGGALFGGIVGAAVGAVNAIAVNETGDDVGQLAMHKMGIGSDDKQVAKADDNVPVIDVHPLPKSQQIADDHGIIWDEPAPVKVAESKPVEKPAAETNVIAPKTAGATPVTNAPVMPAPKDLAALSAPATITPEQADAARVAAIPKDLGKDMLTALSKYEAMQKIGKTTTPHDTQVALAAAKEPFKGFRRYND